jgi:hypothetical protein
LGALIEQSLCKFRNFTKNKWKRQAFAASWLRPAGLGPPATLGKIMR